MPNFKNTRFGLLSRISSVNIDEKPENSVYGSKIEGLRLDSIAIPYSGKERMSK